MAPKAGSETHVHSAATRKIETLRGAVNFPGSPKIFARIAFLFAPRRPLALSGKFEL
jgi:hypothetical protein